MKICIIGTGYVGLVCGACFAEMGNEVICVDNDEQKIQKLQDGIISIFEPGLEEIVKKNIVSERLLFSTSIEQGVNSSLFIFIAVGTPSDEDGSADLSHVVAVAKQIGQTMNDFKIIINKSTVPLGTASLVNDIIKSELTQRNLKNLDFNVVSNPEFLKEGDAVNDFMRPDRIVIGSDNPKSTQLMQELYAQFIRNGHPFLSMDIPSAELTKYAANAMLATRISFMNEISHLCEKVGADIENIRLGIGSDSRIGMSFLYAGLGYGGSCFPKDVRALQQTFKQNDLPHQILLSVESVNNNQCNFFIKKILDYFSYDLVNKKIAVWGLSFKPKTDDLRESPALKLIDSLIEKGAQISCFDPETMDKAATYYKGKSVSFTNHMYEAAENADALILATEWNEFRNPDFEKLKLLLKKPVIFDGRNQYNLKKMMSEEWVYFCIGRNFK